MRKRPFSSDRHKTDQRSGLDRGAELAYDPKSWALEAGQRNAEAAVQTRQALETLRLMALLSHQA
ncbi:hypothetical protein [Planomicrobium sp. YIM 101495]|uniref:hypothetical protein n=1 Tax=Planomicrobium sp. YIM 101495 TaxID=2665160 RepID=UPI0012BA2C82|nr:hypothetical protein [Planomicrobium sp. YIM 101495]MTD31470.1 hypothetical protein [Planomicrobium sp. YIM 101495]